MMSSNQLLKDDLENKALYDFILKTQDDLNISSKKFSNFITFTLPKWISMKFFPTIVEQQIVT
jgi:hypothetical protein